VSDLRFFEQLGVELEHAAQRRRVRRAPRLWAAIGASGVALSGGIVAAVLLLSAGAPAAYAVWSRVPTTPSPTALETAVHRCYRTGAGNAELALPAPGGSMRPVLAEARGASAAAIYVMSGQVYMCLTVNGRDFRSVDSSLMGPSLRATPGPDQLSFPYGVSGGSGFSGPTHPLSKAQVQKLARERMRDRRFSSLFGSGGNFALGQAGSDVSGVKFTFANRKTVVASIQNGWYFAWWPWLTEPTSVTVTASTGAITSPLGNHPHDGWGLRPYPACRPGASRCVFAANRPAAATTSTSTSAGTTPTPTTTGSQLATAKQTCDGFSMSSQSVPADVFVRRPALTDLHGVFTALISVSNGKAYGCLTGGDQKNVHKFFDEDLVAFGPVHAPPGPDQLSVPYPKDGGGGGGRIFGGPPGRHASQAELEARMARVEGGGYGPYTLGQAGSDITAVTFSFANGKTVAAIIQNGWYFAWWPWISKPTSVSVITDSGTITSPLTSGTNPRRSPISPGCRPGSHGCVFAKPRAASPTSTTTMTGTTPR
jgi:hypothetical protein